MKTLFWMVAFLFSFHAHAESAETSKPQCLDKAMDVAKSLDKVNGSSFARQEVTAVPTLRVNQVAESESALTFNFDTGDSYLEVVYKPNFHKQGDCVFESAVVVSAE